MKKSKSSKSSDEKKLNGKKEVADDLSGKPDVPQEFLIVGIGASAGGIQALKEFFSNVAADSGVAYVVILHLSPDHDSRLAEVLQTVAPIPVRQVKEKVRVEPNCVYVVPPNEHLEMFDGHIVVTPNISIEERRAPVDIFFRTLAESHHARAVAVILSGTGANGSMGIKRVKERGGAAFVQNPREAEFSEMPRHSIATDLIDQILNVAEIPAKIIAYQESLGRVEISVEPEQRPEEQQFALREIFTTLRLRTGHDFSNYKRPTILRRIERRINVFNLPDLTAYAAFVRDNRDEATALLKDLLISVTNFFRDQAAFQFLENEVLPKIFHNKQPEDQVRIWVAGCATGEEAYGLAMLCAERTWDAVEAPSVQIFASDIDEQAIQAAREGLYTLNDAADVSAERLRRFFTKEGDGYRVRRELRELILFANHNVIKDPPFSKLDLATCRNMLIYLNQTAQERVMEMFHFALNPGGFLFLGNSESADGASDLYATLSKEHHVFQSRLASGRIFYPVPDASNGRFHSREFAIAPVAPSVSLTKMENDDGGQSAPLQRQSFGDLHQQLLEQYAPPSIIVNEEYEILHLSETAGRFLQIAGGEPTKNLLKLIRPELRLELRAGLYQAVQNQTNVEIKNLKINHGAGDERINIYARPVLQHSEDTARGFILVLFETARDDGDFRVNTAQSEELDTLHEPLSRQLEEELMRTKSQLRGTIEQFDIQAEELKASNEELQAMNEELRSAAEELETSKEELQSVNEELITVNQELKIKLEELSLSNNDFQNLINSTDVATIFLDRSFRVHTFTPAASRIFNLIPADFGRPLTDITHRLEADGLLHDAEKVLETLQTIEREARTTDGRTYLLRVLPYRTKEDRINGVVATFLDITERKRAEVIVRESEDRLQKSINIETVGVLFFNNDIEITDCNDAFLRMSGYTRQELRQGRFSWEAFTPDGFVEVSNRAIEELNTTGTTTPYEKEYVRKDGSRFWALFAAKRISENEIVEFVTDITEQKRAEELVRESREQLRLALDASEMGTFRWYPQEDRTEFDVRIRALLGLREGDAVTLAESLATTIYPDDREFYAAAVARSLDPNGDGKLDVDYRVVHPDGSLHWLHIYGNTSFTSENPPRAALMYGMVLDITERKRTEANLAFLAEVSQDLVRLTNIDEAINALGAKIAEYFNVARVFLAEIDDRNRRVRVPLEWHKGGAPHLFVQEFYNMDDFISEEFYAAARAGEMIVVADTRDDSRTTKDEEKYASVDTRSFVTANFVRSGEWLLGLSLTDPAPREWRDDEIELIREITSRIWTRLERARTEEALRASEERYGLATRAVKAVIYDWNVAEDTITRSQELENLLGYSPDDKDTQTNEWWKSRLHPQDAKRAVGLVREKIKSNATRFEDEYRMEHRAGHYVWVSDTGIFLHDERGKVVRCVGSVTNINERKEAEAALRESEGRLRALVENLPGGAVFIVDKNLRYLIAEGEALAPAGFKPENLIGRTIGEAMPRKIAASYEPLYRQALAGKPFESEHEAHKRTFISRGVPLTGANGDIYAVLAISYDITERRKAEEVVRKSEERLRLATEASEMAMWEWNLLTDKVFWNRRHFELFGMKPRKNPLKPDAFFKHVHPDDRASVTEQLQTALAEKSTFDADFRAVLDGGGVRWMSGYGRVVEQAGDGAPIRMSGVMLDITERKESEQALRESEIRYRAIVGQSTAGITELDLDGVHALANPGYCEILGYTEKELSKMNLRDVTHPDDYAHCLKLFRNTIKNGTPHTNEKRVVRKTGEILWITETISRITDAHGSAHRVAMIAIDITNRRRAEEALAESETRLRLLVESASDYAIFTTTLDGLIDSWNAGAEKVFGWTEAEVLGKPEAIIFTPEDLKKGEEKKEMKIALQMGRAPDERFHIRQDGSRFYASGVMTVLKNEGSGAAQGFVKIARDMTEQIEAEKALREKELLQRLVGAQEDERKRIARDLHDELGQQLTALRLKLDVARNLCEKEDELCGKIDEIELIAKSIDQGVDFLAWELRPAALDHLGLVAALEHYVEQWSHYSGVTAELLASKLKRARFAPETETNLYRIVQETLNNTHKHARAKRVEIALEKRGDLIVLIVEDDGIGFDPKDRKKRQKGMGLLGMQERAALIGGELEVESAPQAGTTIYVRVPAVPGKREKLK